MALCKPSYEPTPRYGHLAVAVGHRQFTWGGVTGYLDWDKSEELARIVEVFDLSSEQWEKWPTRGPPHPGYMNAAYTTIGTTLYSFGGWSGGPHYNCLLHLDLFSLEWEEVVPRNPYAAPQRKSECQMVSFQDNKLVVFAGRTDDRSTNELHVFNLQEGTWSSPRTTGDKPPPCNRFTLTKIDYHHAVMFGGDTIVHSLNDVLVLELGKWHWTKLEVSGPKPSARSRHAACCLAGPLTGQEHPLLMIVGGNGGLEVFNDGWILDVDQRRWTKLDFPGEIQLRYSHTATMFGSAPGFRQVVLHGGQPSVVLVNPMTATTLLNLELQRGRWRVTGVIPEDQLGRPEERLKVKMENLWPSPPPTQQTSRRAEERAATLERSPREGSGATERLREKMEKLSPSPPTIQQTSHRAEERAATLERSPREGSRATERRARAAKETTTTVERQEKQSVQAESRATFLEQRVRLAQLQIIKTPEGKKVEIIKSLAVEWKSFGCLLDFDDDGTVLNLIEAEYRGHLIACCQEMFQKWLRGSGRQPATWELLIELLEDSEHKHLASQIRHWAGSS